MMPAEELDSDVDEPGTLVGDVGVCVTAGVVGVEVGVWVAVPGLFVTVTRKLPEEVLPASSVAEQLTVVTPTINVEPDAGAQTAETEGSMASVAEAE